MRETTVKLYYLSELPTEKAKERAREFIREQINSDDFDATEEDCSQVAQLLGFSEVKLMWSGFYTQGSGACLVGRWYACNVYPDRLKAYAPVDEKLHKIAEELQAVCEAHPGLCVKTRHNGHYYHENSVDYEFEGYDSEEEFDAKAFREILRDLMRWCYKQLEEQNDYLNSAEHVDQEAAEREYEFTANGKHWSGA